MYSKTTYVVSLEVTFALLSQVVLADKEFATGFVATAYIVPSFKQHRAPATKPARVLLHEIHDRELN